MKEIYLKAFNSITEFVNDLWEVFGIRSKVTPLALYKRLIEHIKFTDEEAIMKAIQPFSSFVKRYNSAIISGNLDEIPRGEIIRYGENNKIVIEIQKFIYKGDNETKTIIRQYLLTINAILNPSKEAIDELEKKRSTLGLDDSYESNFLTNVMDKAKTSMQDIDTENPSVALASLAQSGVIQELFSGLQTGMASGEMDFGKLVGSMQGALGNLMKGMEMPEAPKPARVEEVVEEKTPSQSEEKNATNTEESFSTNTEETPTQETPNTEESSVQETCEVEVQETPKDIPDSETQT